MGGDEWVTLPRYRRGRGWSPVVNKATRDLIPGPCIRHRTMTWTRACKPIAPCQRGSSSRTYLAGEPTSTSCYPGWPPARTPLRAFGMCKCIACARRLTQLSSSTTISRTSNFGRQGSGKWAAALPYLGASELVLSLLAGPTYQVRAKTQLRHGQVARRTGGLTGTRGRHASRRQQQHGHWREPPGVRAVRGGEDTPRHRFQGSTARSCASVTRKRFYTSSTERQLPLRLLQTKN